MIISLFMEPTPLSGGRGTRQAAGQYEQQQGQEPRQLRSNDGQKRVDHVSETAGKLNW
jgi:hypothetical protein